jgi:hypothetical protein
VRFVANSYHPQIPPTNTNFLGCLPVFQGATLEGVTEECK